MPVSMWIFIVLAVLAVIGVIIGIFARGEERAVSFAGAIVAGVVGLVFFAFAATTVVGTRQIGIETKFGRPTGTTLTNGLHLKSPVTSVTEMDGAVQIDQHKDGGRIKVLAPPSAVQKPPERQPQ
ncbi:hypothetical protein MABM_49990 [Mycobacteroides abscessus]|uniref:NfeD-like C-terminal domain-containing protein n=1 Tax=Mycobacteroides abscessus subsp. bolletii 50594 TaxID=1303024 RepID=A0AB33AE75_9MYCO|nr:hypothetical protein MASS_3425 [Mycobacteroides abscessus subsp. bolletii 50594]BBZ85083.1 hypothetical protein MABM_49990 [Mycobacteroides abscessus]